MKFWLLLMVLFPLVGLSQTQKEFFISDSIIIQSSVSNSAVLDINMLGDDLWVRFDQWEKDGNYIELASPENSYLFKTRDSSIITSICALYPVSLGFMSPKYSGKNRLVLFDTLNKRMEFPELKVNTKGYIIHHNTEGLLRNSFYYDDKRIIFNRSSLSPYVKTENQISRSLKRIYKKERPFVSYDPNTKEQVFFGGYPDVYKNRSFLLANPDYFFSVDPEGKYLYVSFQASDDIIRYNLENYERTRFSSVRGESIDPEKLLTEYKSPADFRNSEFLNLLADSYDEIYPLSHVVIRTYRKSYNDIELKELWPPPDFNVCVNPKVKMNWFDKRLNKKMYLQQFDLNGNLMFEASVPSTVNTFIGYNSKKEEYYFWMKTRKTSHGRGVIYIFKTRSI